MSCMSMNVMMMLQRSALRYRGFAAPSKANQPIFSRYGITGLSTERSNINISAVSLYYFHCAPSKYWLVRMKVCVCAYRVRDA